MRWTYFFILQGLLIALLSGVLFLHKDKVSLIKVPPESLAQWYKPQNKRQVWLHNMFKLRRELQAIGYYSDRSEKALMQKWVSQFSEHYKKIADMVPQWQREIDLKSLELLEKNAQQADYTGVAIELENLKKNCISCHQDYRSTTAALYRAPDFESLVVNKDVSFENHMKNLIVDVNLIKISAVDKNTDEALLALERLDNNMSLLGENCSNCHVKDTRTYPDAPMRESLIRLESKLTNGTLREQGEELGNLAVIACARCHGTHRVSYDAKKKIRDKTDWLHLLKH